MSDPQAAVEAPAGSPAGASASIFRVLTRDDLPAILDLLRGVLAEIPLYRWVLGDAADDRAALDWCGEFLVASQLPRDKVHGAFAGDDLVGVMVWGTPDEPAILPPEFVEATTVFLRGRPDIYVRLQEHATRLSSLAIEQPAAECYFAAVHRDHRRQGTLAGLIAPIVETAKERRIAGTMATAEPNLAAYLMRAWGASAHGSVDVGGVELTLYVVDRYVRPQ